MRPRRPATRLSAASDADLPGTCGRSLKVDGKTLIGTGLSEDEVTQTLGRGKSTRTSVSSSGVISLGSKTTGHIFTYDNGGVLFEVTVKEQSTQHMRAFRP